MDGPRRSREGGKECVDERAVCEQFLSAASAERKEVFLEAEVSSGVKAVGRASKIGHGFSAEDGDVKSPLHKKRWWRRLIVILSLL